MTKTIPVYKHGRIVANTLVDEADYASLSRYRWHLNRGYVTRWESIATETGRSRTVNVIMHREVMSCPDGMQVDHLNHDRLDNRRQNLRIVTNAQNHQNRRANPYRGAMRQKNRWVAVCKVNGIRHRGGTFETREEAARAAADLRAKLMPYATS